MLETDQSSVDEYVELCKKQLATVQAEVAKGSTVYILSSIFYSVFQNMKRQGEERKGEIPFVRHHDVYAIWKQIRGIINDSPFALKFKRELSNFINEQEKERKAAINAAREPPKTLKYDDCGPGEYVTYDKDKRPAATFINAQLVLKDLGIEASYNEFTEKEIFRYQGKDIDIHTLRNMMWDHVYVEFPEKTVQAAMHAHCRRNTFHPIKDYFESIRHLKEKNSNTGVLDTWLTKTVGAEDNELTRAIGRKMFAAIVARVYDPGHKFDQMIVFESHQGMGKSTMLEIIAGTEYFNSGKILTMSSKEQMEAVKGRIIYESADLVGHGKADVDSVKAFLSQNADKGRWAYAAEVRDHLRTNIFIGTTNKNNYLLDETGNRRIWPILCNCVATGAVYEGKPCPNEIDLPWLRANRDQLFSEALALYESGYSLVLARELWGDVTVLQEGRMVDIPLTDEAWEVFGLSEQEGLLVADDPVKKVLDIRIFTRDIVRHLFPTFAANTSIGRNLKTALINIKIVDDVRWEYKGALRIDNVVGSGWTLKVTKPEHYDFIKQTMAGWKRRREAKGIANATM